MGAGLVVIIIFYRYILPAQPKGLFVDALGISGIVIGYLLRISARGVKAENNPDGKSLVTKGPYSLTRNPMYLGTLIIGIGFTAMLFRWWVGLVFLIVYLGIYIPEIKKEEEKLAAFFGDDFKGYCSRTPRFFPRINRIFLANPAVYLGIKAKWIKKEFPSVVVTVTLIVIIKTVLYFIS